MSNLTKRFMPELLCFQLMKKKKHFNFNISRGVSLRPLSLDKLFLPLLKILPWHEVFFGNFIFAITARMFRRNHLK